MAYHARAGTCRSGATYSNCVNKTFGLLLGGVSVKGELLRRMQFSITNTLDGTASPTTFQLRNLTTPATPPAQWQDAVFLRGTAVDDIFWGGTIINAKSSRWEDNVEWQVQASDTWLMDRYRLVTATYAGLSPNAILHAILRDFTDGEFKSGYCPSSLDAIDSISFENELVSSALNRLAKAANAYFRIRPRWKRVDIARTFPEGNPCSVDNDTIVQVHGTGVRGLDYEESGALVANRVRFIGKSAQSTNYVSAGATTIQVDDVAPFAVGGGQARIGMNDITYSGKSATDNTLTGCAGISIGVESNQPISVLAVAEDLAAQAALASALGGGRSGVAEAVFIDDRLSDAEARGVAATYLAFYKDKIPAVTYTIDDINHKAGKVVTFDVTDPLVISGDFRIQQTTIIADDDIMPEHTLPRLQVQVTGRLASRLGILDVLVQR